MDPQTTTLDALDASLQELTKAAARVSGQPMAKSIGEGGSVQIENSGTEGSGGKQDGGQGSESDAGAIESLMIGKLSASGLDAGTIATVIGHMKDVQGGKFFHHERPSPSMSGKKGKKPPMPPFKGKAGAGFEQGGGEEEPDDDDDEDDQGGGQPPMPGAGGPAMRTRKSFAEQFRGDPDVGDGVDVSPFLEGLTARTTEALDTLDARLRKSQKKMKKSLVRSDEQFVVLAKSVVALGSLAKSQANVISELGKRLGIVERQPAAPPKGATTLEGGPRSMAKSLTAGTPGAMGGAGAAGLGSLKKSEVASVATYMNLEKGIKNIGGISVASELAPLIDSGTVPEGALSEIQNWLKRNPGEALAARNYA